MPTGLEEFDEDAFVEARYFERHAIKVYGPLLRAFIRLARDDATVRGALLDAWSGREFTAVYERPLLLLAALRRDALADPAHPLSRALRTASPDETPLSDEALRDSLAEGRGAREALRTRFVQTNEVTRAVAWRLPLGAWQGERGVALVDLGCSAGCNLVADRLGLAWTDGGGAPLPLADTAGIAQRIGLDLSPVDPRDESTRAWLRACLWPGQTERHARLDRALDLASRALDLGEMTLERVEARDMPARLERLASSGARVLAYQTVFAEYLPGDVRAEYEAAMRAFVARHPGRAMWTELEHAEEGRPGPAELRVHTQAADRVLGSCEYHPTRLELRAPCA
jgi:hypothetical protein